MPTYFGQLTGKNYDSVEAMRHYEGLEAMRRNAPSAEQQAVETMPLDQFRKGIDALARSEHQRTAQVQSRVDLAAFLQQHPEYDDASTDNAGAMKFYLEGQGINTKAGVVDYYQLEDAFKALKEAGFLKLKASEVKKQQAQAVADRMEEVRQEISFNEAEAYSLSMEDLRRRAAGAR